eukprot:TRINITY_DN238_c0_g2_i1.p2 TRINITY_DN238_c0_g2~~TRINITY_DN238_c0_g2_i1.p2  ORF type:complete len:206 (+),score=78.29 TRINITY_DN238_c0_g2_i1:315-932(+)
MILTLGGLFRLVSQIWRHPYFLLPRKQLLTSTFNMDDAKSFINNNIIQIEDDGKPKSFYSIHLFSSWSVALVWFCLSCCFAPCIAFYQRRLILGDDFNKDYTLCQGAVGKCWCPSLAKKMPLPCLVFETFCCTGCAVSGNREEQCRRRSLKDRSIEKITQITVTVLTFFSIVGYFPALVLNSCLLAQQQNEHEFRNENPDAMFEV